MSSRSKWIAILVVAFGVVVAAWAGRGPFWHWLLALHGHANGPGLH